MPCVCEWRLVEDLVGVYCTRIHLYRVETPVAMETWSNEIECLFIEEVE